MTAHVHLTGDGNYFEDFEVGRRMRHARSATIDEVENNFISKQVMNTAQAHWNEAITAGSSFGDGRLVFGLVTGSMTVGLTSQDTAENALAELGLDNVRFRKPVHHGDTLTAYTEVLAAGPADCRDDAGVVTTVGRAGGENFGVGRQCIAVMHGLSEAHVVEPKLGQGVLGGVLAREPDGHRPGDEAEHQPAVAEGGTGRNRLVPVGLRGVHHLFGDEVVLDLVDGGAASVAHAPADLEVLEVVAVAGQVNVSGHGFPRFTTRLVRR